MTPFRIERLANGIVLSCFDRSNRYFGDYNRVCVEIRMTVPTEAEPLELVRQLERMAVPGARVAAVRDKLVEDFLANAGRYLVHADYPRRLAAESGKSGRRWRRC